MHNNFTAIKHRVQNHDDSVNLHIFHTPGACSRVILNAIEEIGEPYSETAFSLGRGEQKQPDYLAINPKGKIPTLIDTGRVITEAPVILYHLARTRPEANLLPADEEGIPTLESLSDVTWAAGALHPAMNKSVLPQMTSASDSDGIRQSGFAQLADYAKLLENRYADSPWFYGADWSIMDYFITWAYTTPIDFGFPLENFPTLLDLKKRCEARESFQRARSVEIAAAEREDIAMPPGMNL